MPSFDIFLNGTKVTSQVTITSNSSETGAFTLSGPANKIVSIETSCLLFINKLTGSTDTNGNFAFTVGPGFSAKGDVILTIKVGNQKKTLDIRFV